MPGPLDRIRSAIGHRLASIPRRLASADPRSGRVSRKTVKFTSSAGYQIHACLHCRPNLAGPVPGVLLCPGIDDPGSVFNGYSNPVSADELARLGMVVMHFDPAGRGASWGSEDFGGPEHQDNVAVALGYLLARPDVVPSRSGVIAFSLGISMAVGALATHGADLPVGWLLDWEGPSDRDVITAGGRIMTPAAGHSLQDEVYWQPREAVRHVGRLKCGYFRYQSARDHAQPGEFRHAWRMLRAAAAGDVPWFQLNDHPRGHVPRDPAWYPPGYMEAHRVILRKVREYAAL